MTSQNFELGNTVVANRDIPKKDILKDDQGVIKDIENIDSEIYLFIQMADGNYIGPSSSNCWNLIGK